MRPASSCEASAAPTVRGAPRRPGLSTNAAEWTPRTDVCRIVKKLIKQFFKEPIDVSPTDIMLAAELNNLQLLRKMLSSETATGRCLDSADAMGMTALHHAAARGHRDVLSTLLRHAHKREMEEGIVASWPSASPRAPPRSRAAPRGGKMQELLDRRDHEGWTALHHAATNAHKDAARMLMSGGASFDIRVRRPHHSRFGRVAS